jgi:hypothetical protein
LPVEARADGGKRDAALKPVYLDENGQDKQLQRWRAACAMKWPLFYGPAALAGRCKVFTGKTVN